MAQRNHKTDHIELPKDEEFIALFEGKGKQVLSEELQEKLEEDVFDLVNAVKEQIKLAVLENPNVEINIEQEVNHKLHVWMGTKEKELAYNKYEQYVSENGLINKPCLYRKFVEPAIFGRWLRIQELDIKKGDKITPIKGEMEYTIKGISQFLTIAVEETEDHFFPQDVKKVS